ncbi:MAG: cupin domain-containing protein [Gemmatimonadales bacterium]
MLRLTRLAAVVAVSAHLPLSLIAAQQATTAVIVAHAREFAWQSGPPSLPAGAQFVLLEGDPSKAEPLTFRLKFPPNYRIPPHYHSVIEHVTVFSGTLNVGMGERASYTAGTALGAGSFAAMPQKMVHYAWTGTDGVEFQLHSVGPWSITYINPKDDPRSARPED